MEITKYSQRLCFEVCLQYKYIIPTCGCADASIPTQSTDTDQAICSSLIDVNCVSSVTDDFDNTDLASVCKDDCPLECDSQEFSTSFSLVSYPSQKYYPYISQQSDVVSKFSTYGGVNAIVFKESLAKVNIYYETLTYYEVKETAALSASDVFGIIGFILDSIQ